MCLDALQFAFTNINREKQNLPRIANDLVSKFDRIVGRLFNPELEFSTTEVDIGPWID